MFPHLGQSFFAQFFGRGNFDPFLWDFDFKHIITLPNNSDVIFVETEF